MNKGILGTLGLSNVIKWMAKRSNKHTNNLKTTNLNNPPTHPLQPHKLEQSPPILNIKITRAHKTNIKIIKRCNRKK